MDVSGLNMLQYGLAATVALLSYQYLKQRFRRRGLSLPPGPPGYPLIGNVLELPRVREWETYAQWSKQYGACASRIPLEASCSLTDFV
jgi:hypothetical protein